MKHVLFLCESLVQNFEKLCHFVQDKLSNGQKLSASQNILPKKLSSIFILNYLFCVLVYESNQKESGLGWDYSLIYQDFKEPLDLTEGLKLQPIPQTPEVEEAYHGCTFFLIL